jgi:WD40 repeat protein
MVFERSNLHKGASFCSLGLLVLTRWRQTLEGHGGGVLKVSFVTTGMQLLSTGNDGLIKLWTIKTGECVKTDDSHEVRTATQF